jgi:D-glycerate 3-kinase
MSSSTSAEPNSAQTNSAEITSAEPATSATTSTTPRPVIIDDKSPHCIPFIISHLATHLSSSASKEPFFIGLNGIQGSGKTTLVSALYTTLSSPPHNLSVLVLSIDDLYLRHADQLQLAQEHGGNKLVQHRGEPGTHDMQLAKTVFAALKEGREVQVPEYDKSAYHGAGDRVPTSQWRTVNAPSQPPIRVIIFEGWCVGFRALSESAVRAAWEGESVTLKQHKLEDLLFVNDKLKEYEVLNDEFDAFIHIDAEETG